MATIKNVQARSEALFTQLLQSQAVSKPANAATAGRCGASTVGAAGHRVLLVRHRRCAWTRRWWPSGSRPGRPASAAGPPRSTPCSTTSRTRWAAPDPSCSARRWPCSSPTTPRVATSSSPGPCWPRRSCSRRCRPVDGRRGRCRPGGAAPGLDYWREDPMANEHHGHWHEVYPYLGRIPEDFAAWIQSTPRATLVAILEAIAPDPDWADELDGMSAHGDRGPRGAGLLGRQRRRHPQRVPRRPVPSRSVPCDVHAQRPPRRAVHLHAPADARPLPRRAALATVSPR